MSFPESMDHYRGDLSAGGRLLSNGLWVVADKGVDELRMAVEDGEFVAHHVVNGAAEHIFTGPAVLLAAILAKVRKRAGLPPEGRTGRLDADTAEGVLWFEVEIAGPDGDETIALRLASDVPPG